MLASFLLNDRVVGHILLLEIVLLNDLLASLTLILQCPPIIPKDE